MIPDRPSLTLIAAMAENRVIGRDNRLPWRLPADLRHFKRLTVGKPILMGRRTWESLPGLLPDRPHIVLTRDPGYLAEGARVVGDLAEALRAAGDAPEMVVVGGAEIYLLTLPLARQLLLTLVHTEVEGDTWFPELPPGEWREVARERHEADEQNPFPYSFLRFERT